MIQHTYVETSESLLNLDKYSDMNKILRITAYVIRFLNNCKTDSERKTGTVTTNELTTAENY